MAGPAKRPEETQGSDHRQRSSRAVGIGHARAVAIELPSQLAHRSGMIYVLTYPEFETGVADRIARFRSEHEPDRAELVPPHVTLVFGLRTVQRSKFLSLCERVAERVPEFVAEFSTYEVTHDPFEKAYKLLLLASTGGQTLRELHEQLYDGPHQEELHPDHPYRPHMTVATNGEQSAVSKLDPSEIGAFPIAGTVRSLEIVELAGKQLHTLHTIPLRRRKSWPS